eukprot:1278000-Pyramimonas_sp.AAC.1
MDAHGRARTGLMWPHAFSGAGPSCDASRRPGARASSKWPQYVPHVALQKGPRLRGEKDWPPRKPAEVRIRTRKEGVLFGLM